MHELLTPGASLYIRKPLHNRPRKTKWDILAVEKDNSLIVINSAVPNKITKQALDNNWFDELTVFNHYKSEYTFGNSRLDFLLQNNTSKALLEVKGVTLIKNKLALFPDAPTKRGRRHLQELISAKQEGYDRAIVLFIIMSGVPTSLTVNMETDPKFAKKIIEATKNGVEVLSYKFEPVVKDQCIHLGLKGAVNFRKPDLNKIE